MVQSIELRQVVSVTGARKQADAGHTSERTVIKMMKVFVES